MILQVPYYSQIKDTKNPDWKNKACGIAALKMVLDFHQPTNLSIDDLYEKGLEINGYVEGVGWYHHSLALLAKNLGFKAITRSWNVNQESQQRLKERGFSEIDLELMEQEQLNEGLYTLKEELNAGHPIIVPMPKNFQKNGSGHLAVLVGYEGENFYFHDPYDQERPGQTVKLSLEEFKNIWRRRAIIIYGKS